ncbi:MAG: polymer-forming cytoskeletal protein [Bacteriovoracaceae bacterium]|nr:polymer-forming cytoskeletal protein [Bacteriovoracaceae bacterium]
MSEIFNFNRLGENCELIGNVTWTGDTYIGGKIQGNVFIEKGTLYVEETGVIVGDIHAQDIVIRGKIVGNISAKNKIVAQSPAGLEGKIISGKLSVFPGAKLRLSAQVGSKDSLHT